MIDTKTEEIIERSQRIAQLRADLEREEAELQDLVGRAGSETRNRPARPGTAARRKRQEKAPKRKAKTRTRRKMSSSERIFQNLLETPGMPFADLTVAVYGKDNSENRKRLRSLLYALKRSGRVRPKPGAEQGVWEAIPK